MILLSDQIAAATAAANADIASGKSDFYAEVFQASGSPLWSGSFGGGSVVSSTAAGVFSVSKSIYAAYAAQVQTLTATDWPYLVMTSGYDTANGATCQQNDTQTVDQCLLTFGAGNAAHLNVFSYDSMHWQRHADVIATTSLGAKTESQIAALYQSTFGLSAANISMSSATIAGGVIARPTSLRSIAQQLMSGTLNIKSYLQNPAWVPVQASNYYVDGSVFSSPAPSNEGWKYIWGHWLEPGGLYYWWAGSGGTVVWMKADFSLGGLVFRVADGTGGEMGVQSIRTAQSIRDSFIAGGYAAPEHYFKGQLAVGALR